MAGAAAKPWHAVTAQRLPDSGTAAADTAQCSAGPGHQPGAAGLGPLAPPVSNSFARNVASASLLRLAARRMTRIITSLSGKDCSRAGRRDPVGHSGAVTLQSWSNRFECRPAPAFNPMLYRAPSRRRDSRRDSLQLLGPESFSRAQPAGTPGGARRQTVTDCCWAGGLACMDWLKLRYTTWSSS